MKRVKLVGMITLVIVASIALGACGNGDNQPSNGKIPDPGGEFSYNRIIVVLTSEASALNRKWAPADFPEFAFSKIDEIGPIGTQLFLSFYLAEPSRENVLRAIYQLRMRSEVFAADVDANLPGGGGD